MRTNTASFYLHSRLVLDAEALHVTTPRAVLGLLPIGQRAWDVPLERLARARIVLVAHADRVLAAVVLVAVAVLAELPMLATVAIAAGAAILLFLGIALGLRITDRTGASFTVPVCVFQRGVVDAAVRQIERAMAARGVA